MDHSVKSGTPKVADTKDPPVKSGAAVEDAEWEMILGEVDINGDGVI